MLPDHLHGYRIFEPLGMSGLSAVYRAASAEADVPVALRVLEPRFADDRAAVAAFRRHAASAAALDHPNIVRVFAAHLESPPFCFAMQYLPAGTLADRFQSARPSTGEILAIWDQLYLALDHAHDSGVLHGDVTPRSILFDAAGNPVLVGFGISEELARAAALADTGEPHTAPYASPEQISGEPPSRRSDIYSLSAVLHEALTGAPPSPEQGRIAGGLASLTEAGPGFSPRLVAVIRRALAPNPRRRYRTAGAAAVAFQHATAGAQPQVATRRRLLCFIPAAAIAASVIGVAGIYRYVEGPIAPGRVTSQADAPSPALNPLPDVTHPVPGGGEGMLEPRAADTGKPAEAKPGDEPGKPPQATHRSTRAKRSSKKVTAREASTRRRTSTRHQWQTRSKSSPAPSDRARISEQHRRPDSPGPPI